MKRRKRYTPEFKAQAVELVQLGTPAQQVAEDLGIASSLLYKWKALVEGHSAQLGSEGIQAEGENTEADELSRMRKELAQLKAENDILKKAAVILGTKNPPRDDH